MAGSRREFYLQNLLDAVNGDTATYPNLVAGTREEKYFQNMIDAASGNDLTYPGLVPVWSNPEGWYEQLVLALQNGGGGSNWEKIATKEFTVSTTSTTATTVGDVDLPDNNYGANDIIAVHIRDKAGKRIGYFYGSNTFFLSFALASGSSNSLSVSARETFHVNSIDDYVGTTTQGGVYADSLYYKSDNHKVTIKSKYISYGTIDGTYVVDVYKLTIPSGMTLFEVES